MSVNEWTTLAVLVGAMVLFVSEMIPVGVTGLCIIAALGLSGVLDSNQTMLAFANPAVVLVGALYVVSASLIRTGVVELMETRLLRLGSGSPRRLLIMSTLGACVASTLLNNTSVVVLMLPIVLNASARLETPPSKVLMPLSFAAILGGTLTLIGTSTNVLVAGLVYPDGIRIEFLDFLPVGAGFALIGLIYLWTIGSRLLPARPTVSSITRGKLFEYVTELHVAEESKAIGKSTTELRKLCGNRIRLLQIVRGEELFKGTDDSVVIETGDLLVLRGLPEAIVDLRHDLTLEALPGAVRQGEVVPRGTTFAELVVTPASELVGTNLASVGLHRRYGVLAVAFQRRGAHLRHGITELPLQAGDVILVQGTPQAVQNLREIAGFILLTGVEENIVVRRRAPIAATIMAGFVLGAAFSVFELPLLALAAFAACLVTGCISLRNAIDVINWNVLLLLAGAIALGLAVHHSGLASRIADSALAAASDLGPYGVLAVIYLLTAVFTELVSNAGAAALMVPIALATAAQGGWEPKPFIFGVAYAASASFSTPIGYQTNAFVYGPAGYRFLDYTRVGLPLQALLWIFAVFALPQVFPF